MKRNLIITVFTAGVLAVSISSCKKNLVLAPNDQLTSQQVFSTPGGYDQAMAKVYGSFALTGNIGPNNPNGGGDISGIDEGASDFFRTFWDVQELTTDEAVITYGDPGVQDLHNMIWTPLNQVSQGLYYRSTFQITLCNNFIQQSTPSVLATHGITGAAATKIALYAAEARFLRAYQYWVLMDVFGNPPFADETFKIGSGLPPQITRKNLYTWLVKELQAIDPLMAKPNQNEYGRADEAAVWALLARIYLNAGVYTGTTDYSDAMTYAKKVYSTSGYGLISNFDNLMLADDNLNSIPGGGKISEFIFTINYDGKKTETYGGSQFLTHASVGGTMPPQKFGESGGYDGSRTTSNIIALFPNPKTKDTTNFPNNGNADTRAQFWYDGQTLGIASLTTFTNGIAVTKFRNVTSTGKQGTDQTFTDVDLPLFRVPEMYLIYAEAAVRSSTNLPEALADINLIRERAYQSEPGGAGDISSSQLTAQFILDERARELFWEGFRRTDLIRYGLFTGGTYVWPWKGGAASGVGVADYRNLMPIPQSDLSANPNLHQNPGYGN